MIEILGVGKFLLDTICAGESHQCMLVIYELSFYPQSETLSLHLQFSTTPAAPLILKLQHMVC